MPSSVVRSVHAMASRRPLTFALFLMLRVASEAARSSRPTASTVTRSRIAMPGNSKASRKVRCRAKAEPGNPSGNVRGEAGVFAPELPSEGRLFIGANEELKCQPDQKAIDEDAWISKKHRVAEDDREHADVHRISNISIQAGDDEMLGGQDRGRRSDALNDKAYEAIQHGRQTERDYD